MSHTSHRGQEPSNWQPVYAQCLEDWELRAALLTAWEFCGYAGAYQLVQKYIGKT